MNEEGMHKFLKIILVVAIVVFVLLALVLGFVIYKGLSPIETSVENQNETALNNSEGVKFDYCQDMIVPDTWYFEDTYAKYSTSGYDNFIPTFGKLNSTWKDGTTVDVYNVALTQKASVACNKGTRQGENVNNYYCHNFLYSKTETNDQGSVIDSKEYLVELTLEYTNVNTNGKKPIFEFTVLNASCETLV